jgi:hypothetical protein
MVQRKRRNFAITLNCLAMISIFLGAYLWKTPQETLGLQESSQSLAQCVNCIIPVKEVLNEITDNDFFKTRHIYLLLDAESDASIFNEGNLRSLFTDFSKSYRDPYNLAITLFNSEEMLTRAINTRKIIADMKDNEETRKYRQEHYPLSKGYLRAYYFRMGGREGFRFSPAAQSVDMVDVVLKEREVHYTNNPETDIFLAFRNEDHTKAKELVDSGIDVNITDSSGDNVLMYAVLCGWDDIIELVIHKTKNINQANQEGNTALLYASAHGDDELIEQLLELGADINARTNDGYSALILAVGNQEIDTVKLLLKKGARVDFKNEYGETALSRAKKDRSKEIVTLLQSFGAKK